MLENCFIRAHSSVGRCDGIWDQSAGFKVAANTGLPVVKSGLIKSAVCRGEARELGADDSHL